MHHYIACETRGAFCLGYGTCNREKLYECLNYWNVFYFVWIFESKIKKNINILLEISLHNSIVNKPSIRES